MLTVICQAALVERTPCRLDELSGRVAFKGDATKDEYGSAAVSQNLSASKIRTYLDKMIVDTWGRLWYLGWSQMHEARDKKNVLIIDHGNNFMTKFGHISQFEVEVGDVVRKGDIVAQVGNTGRTTGPRLYYEVILNDIPQNPAKYIFN